MKTKLKKKRSSEQIFPQILVVVSKFFRFSTNFLVKTKKKRCSSQKFYEISCESTKITKRQFLLANSRAVNTNLGVLGLDLHSSSPEPVNFFGAQSLLGGHKQSFGGAQAVIWRGTAPECPPVAPGLSVGQTKTYWINCTEDLGLNHLTPNCRKM